MNSPAQYLKSQITTMADVAAAFGRDGFSTIDVLVPEDRCAVVVAITGSHNVEQFLPLLEQYKQRLADAGMGVEVEEEQKVMTEKNVVVEGGAS